MKTYQTIQALADNVSDDMLITLQLAVANQSQKMLTENLHEIPNLKAWGFILEKAIEQKEATKLSFHDYEEITGV